MKLLPVILALSALNVGATTLPLDTVLSNSQKTRGLIYPEFTDKIILEDTNHTTTGVMFFYTPDALDGFGSYDNLVSFIENSVKVANYAYANSGIPLKRKVLGIQKIYFDYNDEWTRYGKRLDAFISAQPEKKMQGLPASNYVLVNRFYKDIHDSLGAAFYGSKFSYISAQFNETSGSRTLAHEIGHNEGGVHELLANTDRSKSLMGISFGANCLNYSSIMDPNGYRSYYFFSNPNTYINGHQCGSESENFSLALRTQYTKGNSYLSSKYMKHVTPLEDNIGQVNITSIKVDGNILKITISFLGSVPNASAQLFLNDPEKLVEDFDNPIIISEAENYVAHLEYEMASDWQYAEEQSLDFEIKYNSQVNVDLRVISYNLQTGESNLDFTNDPNINIVNKKNSSGSFSICILLLVIATAFRKISKPLLKNIF